MKHALFYRELPLPRLYSASVPFLSMVVNDRRRRWDGMAVAAILPFL